MFDELRRNPGIYKGRKNGKEIDSERPGKFESHKIEENASFNALRRMIIANDFRCAVSKRCSGAEYFPPVAKSTSD